MNRSALSIPPNSYAKPRGGLKKETKKNPPGQKQKLRSIGAWGPAGWESVPPKRAANIAEKLWRLIKTQPIAPRP